MKITILLGTAREGNESQKVFNFVVDYLNKKDGVDLQEVKVENFLFGKTIPNWADKDASIEWDKIIKDTDALFIVAPEYNHSFPGELKILLDTLYDEYKGKYAGIISTSRGGFAGVRVADQLKLLLLNLNFTVINKIVNVSSVHEFEKADKGMYEKQLEGILAELK